MCVLIFSTTFVCRVTHSKKNLEGCGQETYIGLDVKYPLFLSDFNDTRIFSADFRKYSNIKFHEHSAVCSRDVPCGQKDGRTDMTKLIVAFRNFANAPY